MAPNLQELTISKFHYLLQNKLTTCVELVNAYLSRISQYNPSLKALITVNQNALEIAHQKDLEIAEILNQKDSKIKFLPLHGIPVILKDTYATVDLPTTSGVKALQTLQTNEDAFVVQRLRDAGAIILGKANLHEFSLQGLTLSSLGGQTLNPYDLSRTPGGSSGGTAAALAADFCLVGCGGDTMNSIRSPASACSIVGFRPTKGHVSRWGTMGVSETQDAVGPMARTVADVKVLFDVMRGEDGNDPVTVNPLRWKEKGETQISSSSLRMGILHSYFGDLITPESEMVQHVILDALNKLQAEGLVMEPISLSTTKEWGLSLLLQEYDVQSYEFRDVLNTFLQSPLIKHTPHTTLESIAESGEYARSTVTDVFVNALQPEQFSRESPDYQSRLQNIERLKGSVERCFEDHALDALVYPHQRRLVVQVGEPEQKGRNGILAALTGRPAICIPAGFSLETATAPRGVPIGIELMGKPWHDDELLDIAERFESILQARREPDLTCLNDRLSKSSAPAVISGEHRDKCSRSSWPAEGDKAHKFNHDHPGQMFRPLG
ncbi:hypothetical protein MPDQ_007429 [Monascus purpureus]|uniref:Amidase domain-containing protein n=1 Tax=Monascus purpureus TaxID=5098 RepID=A0A507QVW1_MONPU|nr:hypothetical protein MPDQ_007429 [Monascus purpureus]BDD57534.1 hypothetical protein MAP00_002889 [Monascus purpureus]